MIPCITRPYLLGGAGIGRGTPKFPWFWMNVCFLSPPIVCRHQLAVLNLAVRTLKIRRNNWDALSEFCQQAGTNNKIRGMEQTSASIGQENWVPEAPAFRFSWWLHDAKSLYTTLQLNLLFGKNGTLWKGRYLLQNIVLGCVGGVFHKYLTLSPPLQTLTFRLIPSSKIAPLLYQAASTNNNTTKSPSLAIWPIKPLSVGWCPHLSVDAWDDMVQRQFQINVGTFTKKKNIRKRFVFSETILWFLGDSRKRTRVSFLFCFRKKIQKKKLLPAAPRHKTKKTTRKNFQQHYVSLSTFINFALSPSWRNLERGRKKPSNKNPMLLPSLKLT